MATVDKTSVREEVDRLKNEFERLCSEGKGASETRVLMNSLFVVRKDWVDLTSIFFPQGKA